MLAILILLQGFFYYLARFKKRLIVGIGTYAPVSYIALALTYYFNAGINGPTSYLFLLSFALLIAFTSRKMHLLWVVLHSLIVFGLLAVEYLKPDFIAYNYTAKGDRFVDIASSYFVTIVVIYIITMYLRNRFSRERDLAKKRAYEIETQRKELERLNDQKNKLFSIVAHDLRSPLNSIQGFLELLQEAALTPEERAPLEQELLQQTRNTSEMLFNLLSWSKAQMDGTTLKLSKTPVYKTVRRALEIQTVIAARKDIKLSCDIDEDVTVMADADMLQLVVRNLLNNAVKFSRKNGEVKVWGVVMDSNYQIAVSDSGIGIPPEMQTELFSFKTSSTRGTENEKGVGLGLVLCKEFIELQHGKIWFDSIPDKGTTFYISLPVAARTVAGIGSTARSVQEA